MNGFDPLGGLKDWHLRVLGLLTSFGIISVVVMLIKFIVWVINHV